MNLRRIKALEDRLGAGLPCPECGHDGTMPDKPFHVIWYEDDEPDALDQCTHCGHPTIIRIRWDDPDDQPVRRVWP
jgi:DNA-directed RNA polymerase subunit RPC12/RpoP